MLTRSGHVLAIPHPPVSVLPRLRVSVRARSVATVLSLFLDAGGDCAPPTPSVHTWKSANLEAVLKSPLSTLETSLLFGLAVSVFLFFMPLATSKKKLQEKRQKHIALKHNRNFIPADRPFKPPVEIWRLLRRSRLIKDVGPVRFVMMLCPI